MKSYKTTGTTFLILMALHVAITGWRKQAPPADETPTTTSFTCDPIALTF